MKMYKYLKYKIKLMMYLSEISLYHLIIKDF